jgi:hypothetical protein
LPWNSSLYNRACAGAISYFLHEIANFEEAADLYRSFVVDNTASSGTRVNQNQQMRQLSAFAHHRLKIVGVRDERFKTLLDSIMPNRIKFQYAVNELYMTKKRRKRRRGIHIYFNGRYPSYFT